MFGPIVIVEVLWKHICCLCDVEVVESATMICSFHICTLKDDCALGSLEHLHHWLGWRCQRAKEIALASDAATPAGRPFPAYLLPLPLPCREDYARQRVKILEYILCDRLALVVAGRKKPAPRVAEEGGHVRPSVKGKNFCKDEEEQLCRNVLHVTQDRIVGNQQRAGVFWERITTHYQENQPQGPRP